MEKNLFEGAKFGDKFRTRDGRMAIYVNKHRCVVDAKDDSSMCFPYYDENGIATSSPIKRDDDIVSKWQEPINEEELDKLAGAYMSKHNIPFEPLFVVGEQIEAYKAGYRKAKMEK